MPGKPLIQSTDQMTGQTTPTGMTGCLQYYRSDFMNKPLPSHYAVRRRETEFVRSCVLMAKLIASTDGKSRAPSLRWYLEDARLSGTREEALEMIADRVTELSNEKYDWPPETAAE